MPIFNYTCKNCGHELKDKLVAKSDTPVLCPVCNEVNMDKELSCCNFTININ